MRVDAHGLRRIEQPEHEVQVVGGFHNDRRELYPLGDLGAQTAAQMPADHDGNHIAQRAVSDLLLGVGEFRIEALRVADGELEAPAPGQRDQLVGLPELQRYRLLQEHVLAGAQAIARDRIMILLRRGADIDDGDIRVLDDVLIIEGCCGGPRQRLDLRQAVGPDLTDVELVDQRRARQRLRPDAPAPSRADHCDFDPFHSFPLLT